MAYEWDPETEQRNNERHGINFTLAARIFQLPRVERRSDRIGERRWMTETIYESYLLGGHVKKRKVNIVRYTDEEIEERIGKGLAKVDWDRINAMTPEEIERNALEENRRLGIPDDWYKGAYAVYPVEKERITIRIDKDVLDHFRKQGKGYQSRINAVLRAFVTAESNSR